VPAPGRRFVFGSGKLLSVGWGNSARNRWGKTRGIKNTTRCRAAQKRYEATVVSEGGTVKRPACAPGVAQGIGYILRRAVSRGHANGCGATAAVKIRPIGASSQSGGVDRLPAIHYATETYNSEHPKGCHCRRRPSSDLASRCPVCRYCVRRKPGVERESVATCAGRVRGV
jgi:hypothetical protein